MKPITIHNWLRYVLIGAALLATACTNGDDDDSPNGGSPATAGEVVALTDANRLITFNLADRSVRTAVAVTGLSAGERLLGLDRRPNGSTLIALTSANRLVTLNADTGAIGTPVPLVAATGDDNPFTALTGTQFGVDFNPVPDRLRVVSDTGQNLRINVDNGQAITDGNLTLGGAALAGTTAAAYTNNFSAACRTALFYLDSTADRLLTTSAPNDGVVTTVGALGVDVDAVNGFDITTDAAGINSAVAILTVGNVTGVYTLSTATGAATLAGAVTGLNNGEKIIGLTLPLGATAPAQAKGELFGLSESNKLVSFNRAAPGKLCTSATITGLAASEQLLGIDFRPADGKLYGLGNSGNGRLYEINTDSAAAGNPQNLVADAADTTAAFTSIGAGPFAVDFNPVPDRLRVISSTGLNLRINPADGKVFTDENLTGASAANVTAAAYTHNLDGTGITALYALDSTRDKLIRVGSDPAVAGNCPAAVGNPNCGVTADVGDLGQDITDINGFDIEDRNGTSANVGLVAAATGTSTTSQLFTLNLATGGLSSLGTIGGGERIKGLARPVPQVTIFGATTDNRLLSFKPRTPGVLLDNRAITGLQGGETIVGIDFRPATGALIALTSGGRLYTLDPATAAMSGAIALQADMADTTAPFAMLDGTAFGIDFNPVPDRLRVISDTEQNLRINVTSGAATTDASLTPVGDAMAAAYTNNFAGAAATELFALDATTNSLTLITPPNDGVVTNPQTVSTGMPVDFTKVGDLDIGGGANGIVLAALELVGATGQSKLFRINLATGAATDLGLVGQVGTPALTGMAIQIK